MKGVAAFSCGQATIPVGHRPFLVVALCARIGLSQPTSIPCPPGSLWRVYGTRAPFLTGDARPSVIDLLKAAYQSGDRALGVTQIQVRCGAIHLALGEVLGGYRARGRKGRTDRGPTPEGVGGDRGRLSGLGGGGHPFAETVIGEGRDDTGLTIGDGS